MTESMSLEILPVPVGTLEYKLSRCFFKGSSKAKAPANTSQEKAAAEVALSRFQRYMDIYRPLENAAISDVISDNAGNRIERWAGERLNADAAQTLAAAAPGLGKDPSSGTVQAGVLDPQKAAIVGKAAGDVAGLGRKQKIAGLDAAIAIGSGQARDTQLAFNDLAGISLEQSLREQEIAFNADAQNRNTWGSAIGALAGFGKNIYENA